jgi:hypothetical protein
VHDGTLGGEHHDAVRAHLGELLDHPLGPVPLHRGEADGDGGLRSRLGADVAVGIQSPAIGVAAQPPRTGTVGGHDDLTGPQAQHACEVVRIRGGGLGDAEIAHENLGRSRGPHRHCAR